MCLLVAAYRLHPEFPLIVAANRDEFFHRPTAPAHYWDDNSGILAGRDLEHGGTWMGVTKTGRFAALTNVRDPKAVRPGAKSRGLIVSNFLASKKTSAEFLMQLANECGDYNGFNLILGGEKPLFYFNSVTKKTIALAPGIYGLSNDQLDTPWPKVISAKMGLEQSLSKGSTALETTLFDLLRDNTKAADSELPDTGVGIEKERWLSPIFIRAKEYGTRCSTLLLSRRDGELQYIERTFDTASDAVSVSRHAFRTLDKALI